MNQFIYYNLYRQGRRKAEAGTPRSNTRDDTVENPTFRVSPNLLVKTVWPSSLYHSVAQQAASQDRSNGNESTWKMGIFVKMERRKSTDLAVCL